MEKIGLFLKINIHKLTTCLLAISLLITIIIFTWYIKKLNNEVDAISQQRERFGEIIQFLSIAQSIENSYLKEQTNTAIAKKLCDAVYAYVSSKRQDTNYKPILDFYINSLKTQTYNNLCLGKARLLIMMLEVRGVPARYVGLFSAIENMESHASVEFFDGNKWLAIDPSFNILWKNAETKEYLSYAEIYTLLHAGGNISWERIQDHPSAPLIENAKIYQRDIMMRYTFISRGIVHNPKQEIYQPQVFPSDWDGVVIHNGEKSNMFIISKYHTYFQGILQ